MTKFNSDIINPAYIQIGRQEAATILGISSHELDRLRTTDFQCPVGFKKADNQMSPVKFRLSDIYTYSAYLMDQAFPASSKSK